MQVKKLKFKIRQYFSGCCQIRQKGGDRTGLCVGIYNAEQQTVLNLPREFKPITELTCIKSYNYNKMIQCIQPLNKLSSSHHPIQYVYNIIQLNKNVNIWKRFTLKKVPKNLTAKCTSFQYVKFGQYFQIEIHIIEYYIFFQTWFCILNSVWKQNQVLSFQIFISSSSLSIPLLFPSYPSSLLLLSSPPIPFSSPLIPLL